MESSIMLERLLTARAGWTVAVSIALLVAIGRVKPVRAGRSSTRQVAEKFGILTPRPEVLVEARRLPTAVHRPPSLVRRVMSLLSAGALGVITGVLVAVVIGGGAIWLVGTLTGRLK